MTTDQKQAGTLATLGAVIVEAALVLLVLAIILGISALSKPGGLALAERARAAQIEREQAETAKTLAEAGKAQAEGEAASVTMTLFCFVGLPLLGVFLVLYFWQSKR